MKNVKTSLVLLSSGRQGARRELGRDLEGDRVGVRPMTGDVLAGGIATQKGLK
jgi:hypothetical protein